MYRGPSLYRHCLLPKILPLNRICCYKELDMDPSKALIMDTFEHFFINHIRLVYMYLLEAILTNTQNVCFPEE